MTGGLGSPGAESLEVIELEAIAAHVELNVLGKRAVSNGQDEAVATDPLAVGRVTTHDLLEEQVSGGREAHGRSGVAVAHLLHCIGSQHTNGVHSLVIDGIPLEN